MTGWRIHAWVLMGNHYHLVIETPEPNLVAGCSGSKKPTRAASTCVTGIGAG
jgi:REP element-mobilizing transposase RayT